ERPSAHHTPNALQSSRKIAPRKISSSTVPSSEPISACQGAAAVGPVIAYAPVASSTTMMAEKSATPCDLPQLTAGTSVQRVRPSWPSSTANAAFSADRQPSATRQCPCNDSQVL